MQGVILLGAPGAGKGTVAEGIRDQLGFTHVSTGDMLREAIRENTELGKEAQRYIQRGDLVPDQLIMGLVTERLDRESADGKYLFDGFPRTLDQARMLDQTLASRGGRVNRVFLLEVPRDVLIDRLTGRRICRQCGANFHVRNIPPKTAEVCDSCGGELYQRPDDTEKTIVNRLEVFNRQMAGLIAYYASQGVLERVDASRHRDETIADLARSLRALPA